MQLKDTNDTLELTRFKLPFDFMLMKVVLDNTPMSSISLHEDFKILVYIPRAHSCLRVMHEVLIFKIRTSINVITVSITRFGKCTQNRQGTIPVMLKPRYAMRYLGYYTDAGAYYYYNTEDEMNYDETFEFIRDYVERIKFPIKFRHRTMKNSFDQHDFLRK